MSRKESLQKITKTLLKRRSALRSALDGDLSLLKEQAGGDEVDWAIDAMQDDLNSQLAEVESRELKSIDAALTRVVEGRFGRCGGCDRPIPLDRLRAIPHAAYCIACQREAERNPVESDESASWANLPAVELSGRPLRFEDLEIESF
ncbi:MAG: TraR/DksA family transcriptional regulator [Planctomycetales bacterium]|nr:TraR/DksA family transcriptional regulator [Planctomycetales bacterium]